MRAARWPGWSESSPGEQPYKHPAPMRHLIFALMLPFACHFPVEGRTWTDQQGRTFEGDWIELAGDEVRIMRSSDRRIFNVPVDRLSGTDKEYILKTAGAESQPSGNDDDLPKKASFKLERFEVSLENGKPESIRMYLKYNYRTVWEGRADVPGEVDLRLNADTDFLEEPREGSVRDDAIYLYIESEAHATQWHRLQRSGDTLVFSKPTGIRLYKKRFAIVEYAFYQGDDPDFAGRTPTHAGVAAVGHWGRLPGFRHDWQIWQGSLHGEPWGNTLLLEHHRGNSENGMHRVGTEPFDRMLKAPRQGYRHHGACGEPSRAARIGETYYSRVTGHADSTRGYGKILIRDIVETVPNDIPVF